MCEQYFRENPYFTDRLLKKEYKYLPPKPSDDDKPDENGITEAMIDFSWEQHTEALVSSSASQ